MSKNLAEILGWEEWEVYELDGDYYVADGDILFFAHTDSEEWRISPLGINENLTRLVNNAIKVVIKKYHLKHRYMGNKDFEYLNLYIPDKTLTLEDCEGDDYYQTEFTLENIRDIENMGFNLDNFDLVEVVDY